MTKLYKHVPLTGYAPIGADEMVKRTEDFLLNMRKRRTIRDFADTPVPKEVIENAILTAGTAPSGANMQPWHFSAISDPIIKKKIREAAEVEEREFYSARASERWLADLAPLGTDHNKPFIEIAPWLIVCFRQAYRLDPETGEKRNNYYVHESAGLAAGFLIAALHQAGLATLTHTPSPMTFFNEITGRPPEERAIMMIVTGYPARGATVPEITKKSLTEISNWMVPKN